MAKRKFGFKGFQGESAGVSGVDAVNDALNQLPQKLQDRALKNAMAAGAREIRKEAKRLVPVDEGDLRDSIVVARKVKKTKTGRGNVVVGLRGVGRFYAHLIEFGTSKQSAQPFMRPALDNANEKALEKIGPKLGKEIEKQARKLNEQSGAKQRKAFR